MSLPTDKDIDEAIRRIALSADGALLYRRLQLELTAVPMLPDSGALQANHGRRTLARELKSLMDSELSKRGGPVDRPGAEHDPDRAIVTRPAEPVSVERAGLRRRVEPYGDAT